MSGHVDSRIDLTMFWGKTGPGATHHPAICHMIDVGQVASCFMQTVASPAMITFLSTPMAGDHDTTQRMLSLLAALHDIGKISPGFQRKVPELATVLLGTGFSWPPDAETDHGAVTRGVLRESLCKREIPRRAAHVIADALGAHHGEFHRPGPYGQAGMGKGLWEEARELAIDELARVFSVNWRDWTAQTAGISWEWALTLAGLVSVCDWIGSSTDHFPPVSRGVADLEVYAAESRERARRALEVLGWTGWRPFGQGRSFTELFGREPYDFQVQAAEAAARLEEPGIIVIEAPMGMGKTEAAIWVAEQALHRQGLSGIYFALPTQATSNQMFGRVRRVLERRYEGLKVNLQLLHGLSDLNEEFRELRIAAVNEDAKATVEAATWFAASKRGLLAPFGVGTIDQSLLAVLLVRHMCVRLFGLGQKVVIFDEVHAYDTYMSHLLDRLLSWLARQGTTVVILSATLPSRRRRKLLEAYTGRGDIPETGAYPQIVAASVKSTEVRTPSPGPARLVQLERVERQHCQDIPRILNERLAGGGCAAVICNTVQRAQELYQDISCYLEPAGVEVMLFHARFPVGRRLEVEGDVLRKFGPDGLHRPRRAVLVATQVIEQSLDLDFDLMVTEIAPIDLMLQRVGRLHRHSRRRPPYLCSPTLLWISPELGEAGVPDFGGSQAVYERYILLRSWLALRDLNSLELSVDLPQLVEQVYGEVPWEVPDDLRSALVEARQRLDERSREDEGKARSVVLLPPTSEDGPIARPGTYLREDSTELHETLQAQTRLTRPSVTLVCAEVTDGILRLLTGTDAAGGVLDLKTEPDRAAVREIRMATITLQDFPWVRHFVRRESPGVWDRSVLLRGCRLAVFTGGALAAGLETRLELSRELGLVIVREGS